MTQAPPQRRSPFRLSPTWLAWATVAGVVIYIGIDVLLAYLRPTYSLIYNAESDYGRGPWFWVMDLNFLLRGAFSASLIAAMWPRRHGDRRIGNGLHLLMVGAVCSGLLAFFADDLEGQRQHGSGIVHLVLAFVAFVSIAVGAIMVSTGLRSDPTWKPVSTWLLVIAVLGAAAFLVLGGVTGHHHAPDGLVERIFLGLELSWIAVAAGFIARRRLPGVY